MKKIFKPFIIIFLFLTFLPTAFSMIAFTDKVSYTLNETMIIKINSTTSQNISAQIQQNTNILQTFEIEGEVGVIEYYHSLSGLSEGSYQLQLTQGSDSVTLNFEIQKERYFFDARLIGNKEIILVNTTNEVTEGGQYSGNFSELLNLSISGKIYFGEVVNLTGDGRNYSFVLVDENIGGVYDTIYLDDDRIFLLYDSDEDDSLHPYIETYHRPGDRILEDFVIYDVEIPTGKKVILGRMLNSTIFSPSRDVYLLGVIGNESGYFKPYSSVEIKIMDENNNILESFTEQTNGEGYFSTNFTSPSNPGTYFILLNSTPSEIFSVELFKLFAKVTDISNNPSYTFAPNSWIKIWVISKSLNDEFFNLSKIEGFVRLPNGVEISLSFKLVSTGTYVTDFTTTNIGGKYRVVIRGEDSLGRRQKFETGFEIQSVGFEAMTVNPKYVDEPGPEIMMNAFAPGSNVTIVTFLLNISKGRFMEGGPCGGGICIQTECKKEYYRVVVKDEKGNLYPVNYSVMNISTLASMWGKEPPEEEGVPSQCIIVIWGFNNTWLSNTGSYKVDIKLSHPIYGDHFAAESFEIRKVYASGSTVDFKGEEFSFLAPNTTIRIKLKIRNLITDEILPDESILKAEIIEMWKEFPDRKDALREIPGYNKSVLNETVNGSVIIFLSPPEEGFFRARIRFKVNLSNEIVEGAGTVFFELKKYFIWAELKGREEGIWFVGQGKNITLKVNVIDVDKTVIFGTSGLECTGCVGLVADVERLRNDQLFKEFKKGTDFTVIQGSILNKTAGTEITIVPNSSSSLPPGWYFLDIILYNPENPSEKYFGWGWFEIRNLWVRVEPVEQLPDGNYSFRDPTYPKDSEISLGVLAFIPGSPETPPQLTQITELNIENIQAIDAWPPINLGSNEYLVLEESNGNIYDEGGFLVPGKIIKLKILKEEGDYLINLRVKTVPGLEDIGSGFVTISTYRLVWSVIPEEKFLEWPIIYSKDENMTLEFFGFEFDGSDHNLTSVKVDDLFDIKAGRPLKMKENENYTSFCNGNYCQINVSLKNLKAGEYEISFVINDTQGKLKREGHIHFEIRSFLLQIPRILETWIDKERKDTPEKTLRVEKEDRCDNPLWLNWDQCPSDSNKVCLLDGGWKNITLPFTKNPSTNYYAGIFCVNGGRWQPNESCSISMVSNGTNIWVNTSLDLSNSSMLFIGDTFQLDDPEYTWEVKNIEGDFVEVKHAYGIICGAFKLIPPEGHENYTDFYHGFNSFVSEDSPTSYISFEFGLLDSSSENYDPRNVYLYHNTTHLWIAPLPEDPSQQGNTPINFTNKSLVKGPVGIGGIIEDTYGGKWEVLSLKKNEIKLSGKNVLSSGIFINTSLSTSKKFIVGRIDEEWLTFFDKRGNEIRFDLNGDGLTNTTLYFILIDSGNTYDTLAFSKNHNFTNTSNIVSVSEVDWSKRKVGFNDTLILLSIDPRVNRIFFYTKYPGDWAELGDYKVGSNITIPLMVKLPSGAPATANITVRNIKKKTPTSTSIIPITMGEKEINGMGEIRINLSTYGLGAGSYEFDVVARMNGEEERLEEWLWPKARVRAFLVDVYSGYGIKLDNMIYPIKTYSNSGEVGMYIKDLYVVNLTQTDPGYPVLYGVAAFVADDQLITDPESYCNFVIPPDADPAGENYTYEIREFDYQYYLYLNSNNQSKAWIKENDCNFTDIYAKNESSQINVTLGYVPNKFMLYILNSTINKTCIGLKNFNQNIPAVRYEFRVMEESPIWYLISINISNKIFDVVLSNSSVDYPMCSFWGISDCVKMAWFDDDGDMSDSFGTHMGENFTQELYLMNVGPSAWDGVIVGNYTLVQIGEYPRMWGRIKDFTPVYFMKLNESAINFDLNMDKEENETFYLVAFDEYEDGISKPNRILIDDDLEITEPWWGIEGTNVYYDFYGNETGMEEKHGSPPTNLWGGYVEFGNCSDDWESSPNYELEQFDTQNNKIRLMKPLWQIDKNKKVSILIKAYTFEQQPIQGAGVTLNSLYKFSAGLFENIIGSVTYQNDTVTDNEGYYMIFNLIPTSGYWEPGDYLAILSVTYGSNTETVDTWFRVGEME